MRVHERILAYLNDHHVSKENVARKMGIPEEELNAILNGDKPLYADELRSICFALQVKPEMFLNITT